MFPEFSTGPGCGWRAPGVARQAFGVGERPWWREAAAVRRAALDALATLVPVDCPGCGASAIGACAACRAAVRAGCEPWSGVFDSRAGPLPISAASSYEGTPKALLAALKERGRTDAAAPLGALLRVALAVHAATPHETAPDARGDASGTLLVPVPSRPAATRRRGFVPIELIVRAASGRLVPARVLEVRGGTRDQAGLDRDERRTNLEGAMRSRTRLDGRRVLLVDDVVTTGATLREAARAAAAAGAVVLGAVTVARTPKRHERTGRQRARRVA